MVGAVRTDREAWPLMRTGIEHRVVIGNAMERFRRRGIGEGDHRVVTDASFEDIAEQDYRFARTCEGHGDTTALAGVVLRDPRVRQRAAGAILPGIGQRSACVWLVCSLRGSCVALV